MIVLNQYSIFIQMTESFSSMEVELTHLTFQTVMEVMPMMKRIGAENTAVWRSNDELPGLRLQKQIECKERTEVAIKGEQKQTVRGASKHRRTTTISISPTRKKAVLANLREVEAATRSNEQQPA
ncbi:hypothetical protein Ahy_A02g007528 isoform A [Arachis hypogaea]|uniref:Uncharacterized protein n=1 Tax=Arachis hypogaea TaxID=3818 RepID=A0A445ECP1_ARAHY|nr:hypothetical protein Ahy_A02g007528 isoform A [Arachis hypogaea]